VVFVIRCFVGVPCFVTCFIAFAAVYFVALVVICFLAPAICVVACCLDAKCLAEIYLTVLAGIFAAFVGTDAFFVVVVVIYLVVAGEVVVVT
jgi:hypothetical protein